MDIREEKNGATTVVKLSGRIDSAVAKKFETALIAIPDRGDTLIIVDFENLDYISSAGLRVLLMTAKKLKVANGKLALCQMNAMIREVFDVSGFSNMLTICSTIEEALTHMSPALPASPPTIQQG